MAVSSVSGSGSADYEAARVNRREEENKANERAARETQNERPRETSDSNSVDLTA